jgi:hypothetical protein
MDFHGLLCDGDGGVFTRHSAQVNDRRETSIKMKPFTRLSAVVNDYLEPSIKKRRTSMGFNVTGMVGLLLW